MPFVAIGIAIVVDARVTLDRARTTWHPSVPERTTSLVTTVVYRYSRNPIYLGMFLVLVGWAVLLASPAALGLSATFVLCIDRFQIVPEERSLLTVAGDDYRDYADRVRRWV